MLDWHAASETRGMEKILHSPVILFISRGAIAELLSEACEYTTVCERKEASLQAVTAEESHTPYPSMNTPICAKGAKSGQFELVISLPFHKDRPQHFSPLCSIL